MLCTDEKHTYNSVKKNLGTTRDRLTYTWANIFSAKVQKKFNTIKDFPTEEVEQ